MNRKIVISIIAMILTAIVAYKGKILLQNRQARASEAPTPVAAPLSVTLTRGEQGSLRSTLEVLATVKARQHINLSTKLAGYVESIPVHESQSVRKGDLLVRIDSTELRSMIAGLKATLAARTRDRKLAESIVRRNLELYAVGGLAKEAMDASRVTLENKKAMEKSTAEQIAQLSHQLSYLEIRAPFDGIIDRLLLRRGDLAAAGKPILSLASREKKLIFSYASSPQNSVQKDQPVYRNGKKIAEITRRYISAASGLAQAEAALSVPLEEPIGANITVSVELGKLEGCLLSADTILHKSDGAYLMLYRKGHFTPLKVSPLIENKGKILLEQCPETPAAVATEVKLARLPSYGNVTINSGTER